MGQAIQAVLLGKEQPQAGARRGGRPGERDPGRAVTLTGAVARSCGQITSRAGCSSLPATVAAGRRSGSSRSAGRSLLSLQHNDLVSRRTGSGLANYQALRARPGVPRLDPAHDRLHGAVRPDLDRRGAGGRRRAATPDPLHRLYRTAVFIPVAVSTVATAIIFNWLLDPTYGLANWLLNEVGIPLAGLLQDPDQAMYGIVAMTVWGWVGFDVIIYLAALQGDPPGAARGGRDRRRQPLGDVPLGDAAAARPGDAVSGRVVDDQRAAAVRRDLQHHPRRAADVDHGDRLLPVRSRRSSSSTAATRRRSPTSSSWPSWWSRSSSSLISRRTVHYSS